MTERRKVFSGKQPTQNVHIGDDAGAFRNRVVLRGPYYAIGCAADLQALAISRDSAELQGNPLDAAPALPGGSRARLRKI